MLRSDQSGRVVGPFFVSDSCPPSINPSRAADIAFPIIPSTPNLYMANGNGSVLLSQKRFSVLMPKPPSPPPITPFVLYSQRAVSMLAIQYPSANRDQALELLEAQWASLPEDEKKHFEMEWENLSRQHAHELSDFYNSAEYVDWAVKQNLADEPALGAAIRPPRNPAVEAAEHFVENSKLMSEAIDDCGPDKDECELDTLKGILERCRKRMAEIDRRSEEMTKRIEEKKQKIADGIRKQREPFVPSPIVLEDDETLIKQLPSLNGGIIEQIPDEAWTSYLPQRHQQIFYQRMTPQPNWHPSMYPPPPPQPNSQFASPRQSTPYNPQQQMFVRASAAQNMVGQFGPPPPPQGLQSPRLMMMPTPGVYSNPTASPAQFHHPAELYHHQSPSAYSHASSISPFPSMVDFQPIIQSSYPPEMYHPPNNNNIYRPPPQPMQFQQAPPRMIQQMINNNNNQTPHPAAYHHQQQQTPVREMQNFVENVGTGRRPSGSMQYDPNQ